MAIIKKEGEREGGGCGEIGTLLRMLLVRIGRCYGNIKHRHKSHLQPYF